ncbi:Por secretion system C-terminal sorting domain-containing protein [Dyadobacter sp. SG02]|uniref:T9SS type A sorting domain-containing protein n=1 Tax=Dyadobacter sp. SG02 TaxID=1855291 RepID=UPI0008AED79F|nr:T9SS type A sorting domain-containing protein [Dyadobacter sp. SG02]SEI38231.1 Por secretion system C-terminal sorting domain-containing protein [Dyadobacter sp. SG02]
MKIGFLILSLFFCQNAFAQRDPTTPGVASRDRIWNVEKQVPFTDIYAIRNIGGKLHAASANQVFVANRWGSSWAASTKFNPAPEGIDDLISFKGKLYATGYGKGIYESADNGKSWRFASQGFSGAAPMRFAERKGSLYIATDDQGIQQLNAAGTAWTAFNKGLDFGSSYSFNAIINTDSSLIGGMGANGTLAVLDDQTAEWEIRYHGGRILPGLTTFDFVQTKQHIWAFTNSKAYASSDGGVTWTHVPASMRHGSVSRATSNATHIYAAVNFGENHSIVYSRPVAAPLSEAWTTVDTLAGYYTYGLAYTNGRLYVATQKGLISTSVGPSIEVPRQTVPRRNFFVYPNPSVGHVTLANGLAAGGGEFRLTDVNGKVALSGRVTSDSQPLDISKLAPGTYYYLLTGTGEVTGRLVVGKQ